MKTATQEKNYTKSSNSMTGVRFPITLDTANILGVRVHNVTMNETISLIERMVFGNKKHIIVPVNPELIMAAQKNVKFREVLNSASLVLPDGIGVVLASRFGNQRIKERVTGVDTTLRIAELARQLKLRVFLLGAAPGIAERAAAKLQEEYVGLEIAGTYAGSPHPSEEERLCSLVNALHPHILLIAYGAPKQELWIARNINKLNTPVAMCVGGTFDFIAGTASRAPRIFQLLGIEWFYRLLQQPSRWKRMLALPLFAFAVIRHRNTQPINS